MRIISYIVDSSGVGVIDKDLNAIIDSRITMSGTPARVDDRTIYLKIVER